MTSSDQDDINSKNIKLVPSEEDVNSVQYQRKVYVKDQMGKIMMMIGPICLVLIYLTVVNFDVSSRWVGIGFFIITLVIAGILAEQRAKKRFGEEVIIKDPELENLSFMERAKQRQCKFRNSSEFKRSQYVNRQITLSFLVLLPVIMLVTFLVEKFIDRSTAYLVAPVLTIGALVVGGIFAEKRANKNFINKD